MRERGAGNDKEQVKLNQGNHKGGKNTKTGSEIKT